MRQDRGDILDIHGKLVQNYRFKVLINNNAAEFAKISGLGMDVETEMIAEGGYNGYGHAAVTPTKNNKTLRLERGVYSGENNVLGKLRPGMYLPQGIVVMVLGRNGDIVKKYAAEQVMVTKWELGELDASGGQVLIQTFEVTYAELKNLG